MCRRLLHVDMGSLDFVDASLREAFTSLRMTRSLEHRYAFFNSSITLWISSFASVRLFMMT